MTTDPRKSHAISATAARPSTPRRAAEATTSHPASTGPAPAFPGGPGMEDMRDSAIRTVRDYIAEPEATPLPDLARALETLKRCEAVARWRSPSGEERNGDGR